MITPSDFLSKGLEQIYVRANEIFEDLMDISTAVILFDEMDALVQTRENPKRKKEGNGGHKESTPGLDVTRQLLTTSMLPKLADLHKRARVIFLMATNHREQLDPAITRPGRFDLLLCVGPPSWAYKLGGLLQILGNHVPEDDIPVLRTRLGELAASVAKDLDMFTVADLKSFLRYLKGGDDLVAVLKRISKGEFEGQVRQWADNYIIMNKDSRLREEYEDDSKASRVQ